MGEDIELDDPDLEDLNHAIADLTFDGYTPNEIAAIAHASAEKSIRELREAIADVSAHSQHSD